MNPLLSIILATARPSVGSIRDLNCHLLEPTINSLLKQTYKDFELIVVDSLDGRDLLVEVKKKFGKLPFPFKIVRPNGYWLRNNLWALQNAFNNGARCSKGEWLMFAGDCCEFPPDCFEKCQKWFRQGLAPHLLYVYKVGNKLFKNAPEAPVFTGFRNLEELKHSKADWPSDYICDTRWNSVANGPLMPDQCDWTWYYGYAFVKRDDFFALNGWDENFDGCKPLGDVELGSRLKGSGRWKTVLDPELYVYEHSHHAIARFEQSYIRSNLDMIWLMRIEQQWIANETRWTVSMLKRVARGELTGFPGQPKWAFVDSEPHHVHRDWWVKNPCVKKL